MSTTPPATPPSSPKTTAAADQQRPRSRRSDRRHHGDECVRDFACEPELLFVRHGSAEALQPVSCSGHQSVAFSADAMRCTFQHPPPALRTRSPFDEPVMMTWRASSPPPVSVASSCGPTSCGCDRTGSASAGGGAGGSGSGSGADGQLDDIVEDDESSSGYGDTPPVALHSSRGESMLDIVSGRMERKVFEGILMDKNAVWLFRTPHLFCCTISQSSNHSSVSSRLY